MSKNFNKAVVEYFHQGMSAIPGFSAFKPPHEYAWPGGERAYRKDAYGKSFWVSLILSSRGANEFSVEVGWSFLGRYPQLKYRPNIAVYNDTQLDTYDEAFLRLRILCGSHTDSWIIWDAEDLSVQAIDRAGELLTEQEGKVLAAPLVRDALQCITTKGLELADKLLKKKEEKANHGLESTGAPPAAGTPETHP